MIEEITIKFGTKLKPTQYSWSFCVYVFYLFLSLYWNSCYIVDIAYIHQL